MITAQPPSPEATKLETLSNKKKKKLSERMKALRAKSKQCPRASQREQLKSPVTVKLYDDTVFSDGVQWLDELAGLELPKGKVTVKFSDEVWISEARTGDDVS